jgi:hypothetical protein
MDTDARPLLQLSPARFGYRPLMPLIFHWGGPRHGEVDQLPPESLASSVLVYDGPRWFGVYERLQPEQVQSTSHGPAEVWVVRE